MILTVHIILMVLVWCPFVQSITEDKQILVEKLRPSLDILCPGVDICGNKTEPARNDVFDGVYTSCCKACSCAGDCKRGTCCFPDKNQTEEDTSKGLCKIPVAFEDDPIYEIQRYYLIEKDPIGGCVDENSTCNVLRPYPWGDIWPVISKETRLIYKTPFCAQCHGLSRDDFSQWGTKFVCDKEPADILHFFKYFEMLTRDAAIPTGCMMAFANSGDQYAGNEKCYDNLIQECKDDFKIPDNLNMTNAEVVDSCLNGPRIPAAIGKSLVSFYNPYCYICYGGFPQHLICDVDDKVVKNGDFGTFTALISADKLDLLIKTEIKVPQACKTSVRELKAESECRDVLCPLGQFRDSSGQCRHITDRWLSVDYVVMLDLHLDQNLPKTPLVYEAILEEIFESLGIPSTWEVNAYFHVHPCDEPDSDYNEFSVNFVVDNRIPLKNLLIFLGYNLEREHVVVFDGLDITYSLSINKFYQFESTSYGRTELTPTIPSFDTLNVTKICYNMLKYRNNLDQNEFLISKMFFCDQIKLQPREYRLVQSQDSRVLEYSGRVLYLGEFLVETDYNGDPVVKVCLDDTSYRRVQDIMQTSGAESFSVTAIYVIPILQKVLTLFINLPRAPNFFKVLL